MSTIAVAGLELLSEKGISVAMKRIIYKLLGAEVAGRLAAQAREAEANDILSRAQADADEVARNYATRAKQDILQLDHEFRVRAAASMREVEERTEGTLERLAVQANDRSDKATPQLVRMLLGEPQDLM